jgi:integrase
MGTFWDVLGIQPAVMAYGLTACLDVLLDPRVILADKGQHIGGPRGDSMARRRFQDGSLFKRHGKHERVWVARWREDEIVEGRLRRVYRSEVLGTLKELPTRRLAKRELQARLDTVNDPRYRARPTAKFAEFASRWQATVLVQHKPSTQATIKGHIRKHLVPCFGNVALREMTTEEVQRFISGVRASPKTVRNLFATLQMMWKSARAWAYIAHDITDGVVLPKQQRPRRFFFSLEEVQRILAAAAEPHRTFYWLAAETGMRAGELCALQVADLDLERAVLTVRQSAWRGRIQGPKTENAYRSFAMSPQLIAHLADYLKQWRPNEAGLLFATRNGTPWDANLLVKRKLRPLLRSLGIEHGGLHAFRHTNSSLMDKLGVPIKVRQQRLGHSDPRLTLNCYTHVSSEDDIRFAARLGEILHPNAPNSETGLEEGTMQIEVVH